MDITPLISTRSKVIQSYGAAGIKISGVLHDKPVLVFPLETADFAQDSFDALSAEDLDVFDAYKGAVDVLLIGTGAAMKMLPPAIRAHLKTKGIGVETMDTGAACRSYNILMSDGRRVCALLYPPLAA